ncbi:MAG: type II toxin-antitoxin system VapC family toxin [Luteolibacter sp.]
MICLDTNIWSYLLRQPSEPLVQRLKYTKSAEICLTEMIRAELLYGALRSSRADFLKTRIDKLLSPYHRLPFGNEAAEHYADIRTSLEKSGTPISPNDLIIAATVRAAGATLVTANTREFSRVPGLHCEDWTE